MELDSISGSSGFESPLIDPFAGVSVLREVDFGDLEFLSSEGLILFFLNFLSFGARDFVCAEEALTNFVCHMWR